LVYLGYEIGMDACVFYSDIGCVHRSELYFAMLASASRIALVQVYAHARDRGARERPPTIRY
jgi:hypothetical protein